jgi:3-oxoacyl-[acyl-carrier protein] reductase
MNLGLQQQVAMVSGSSRGIGKAIARSFLAEGARVVITGRGAEGVEQTVRELAGEFARENVTGVTADLTKAGDIQKCIAKLDETWGRIDVLVANIGSGRARPGWRVEEEDSSSMLEINFLSAVRLVTAVLPRLLDNKSGSILFVNSIAGIESVPAPLSYSSAKAALLNYAKNLSREVASLGIRVNTIAPGNIFFPGGSWEKHLAENREKVLSYIETAVPMKRFGTPEEIAAAAVFLCSPKAAFITGACLVADGGQTHTT